MVDVYIHTFGFSLVLQKGMITPETLLDGTFDEAREWKNKGNAAWE